jgi:rhamnose utilization protein RhaD (predicted bifunctional aldolase and dehydrogenase)
MQPNAGQATQWDASRMLVQLGHYTPNLLIRATAHPVIVGHSTTSTRKTRAEIGIQHLAEHYHSAVNEDDAKTEMTSGS